MIAALFMLSEDYFPVCGSDLRDASGSATATAAQGTQRPDLHPAPAVAMIPRSDLRHAQVIALCNANIRIPKDPREVGKSMFSRLG